MLLVTSVFDNTADNPINPDPEQWVVCGRRDPDEMSHLWVAITYLPDEELERLVSRGSRWKSRRMPQEANAAKPPGAEGHAGPY